MVSTKKLEITPELEHLVYKNNATFIFGCAVVILLTNMFWIFFDINSHGIAASVHSIRFAVILFMVVVSTVVAFLLSPVKERDSKLVHNVMNLFVPAVGIETTVLCITKNIAAFEAGQSYNGIPLSSLYLFVFIFIPFVEITESILVVIPVAITVIVPAFMEGAGAYNVMPNAVMGASIILAYFAYRTVFLNMQNNALQVQNEKSKYMVLSRQSLETIAATIDAKNVYLKGHSKRVALYAQDLAHTLGLSDEDISKIYFCGLLHDIGKISISSSILDKPGKLTDEEFSIIKTHTVSGSEILGNMNVYPELRECARSHHERYDGKGYPDHKQGTEVSLFSRIISAADAYDAMTSRRSYRDALDRETVIAEFEKGRCTQFDPIIADAVLEKLRRGSWYFEV